MTAIDAMTEADLEAAIDIDLEAFVPSELGAGAEDPRVVRERSLREELVRPWARLRAARDEAGRLVGYALFWHVLDEVQLLNVAVAIPSRRQGIGRALMNDLLSYARGHAVTRILLEVRASNTPAIALYESQGFTRFNIRPRYYADDEDAVEMLRTL
ncbi:MAG: Ribosomal-protein-S18p-alanine acetyltransferase [Labilithrix sp.]|nr:Ribosomal-protein-S18p-alanine acetyltransferase [Labilithrix sp.]